MLSLALIKGITDTAVIKENSTFFRFCKLQKSYMFLPKYSRGGYFAKTRWLAKNKYPPKEQQNS